MCFLGLGVRGGGGGGETGVEEVSFLFMYIGASCVWVSDGVPELEEMGGGGIFLVFSRWT